MQKLGYLLLGFLTVHSARAVPDGVPTSQEAPSSLGQTLVGNRVSVKPLDLSRAPTTEELMAAGQLGGALYPTRELKDAAREQAARWDFGRAIEEWNKHEYPKAVALFRKHLKDFPDSPWAAEAELHIGCDATYNGRYTEADTAFRKLIADHQGKDHAGARMLLGKARQRLALLKVEQNNLQEAGFLFTALLESPDWRHRTYAAHWIQRLSRYAAAKQALLSCGANALAYVLEKDGRPAAAAQVRTNVPSTMRGHTLADLVKLAASHGYELAAVQAGPADLYRLPLPAILHIGSRNPGDSGHYWVLDKVQGSHVELFDPQSEHRFQQTVDELAREWSGRALVFSKDGAVPGRKLDIRELEDSSGGCCGAPAPPSGTGNPGGNGSGGGGGGTNGCGAPIWRVNVINMNLFVTDTPMWYDPPIGPPVRITVSYNSQSSITHNEPFGHKWMFNYASYLVVDTAGSVLIYMPDGRHDVFAPDGAGGYRRPYQVFNTLTKLAANYFELRFPDDTVYVYRIPPGTSSQQPFLTEIRDAYGQTLSLGYDANVHLTSITDAQGKLFVLIYNANGLVTTVADPFGRTANFQYDANNTLIKVTDMGGYWSTYSYDTNDFVTSIGDERGTTYFWTELPGPPGNNSNNYPPPGDPNMFANYRITVTNPLGQREEFFYYGGCDIDNYNGCSGYTWYVSPRDYIPWQSQQVNNYRSRVPKTRYIPTTTASGQHGEISQLLRPEGDYIQYGYDTTTGDRTIVTDSHSPAHAWRYTFNSMGRVTSVTDAKGTPTAFIYATNGVDLLSVSNSLGQVLMAYNSEHDLVSLTDRLTNTTTFDYNGFGQILSQVDAVGITNEYSYDASQRFAELRRAGQTLESYTYDAVGRVQTRTDATGFTVANDYNNLNQVLRVTYPDGRSDSYSYSTCCPRLLDSMTDRGGRTTVFIHDALKRLLQTVNSEGGITQFGYDANGNRTSLTDPNGNTTSFTYDLDNRLIRKTYADGKGLSFGYDADGLLTTRTNARGITTIYTYDANHNLLTTTYSDGTPGVTNTFDDFNRLTLVKDGLGTNAYAYDANSRLTSFDGPWANDTITYAYDALGRRTNLLVQGSQPTGYGYDAFNRLKGVRVGAQAYAYAYASASPLVQRLDRPNGSFTTYQYDGLNRLTGLSNRRSTGEVVNEFLYTYNAQDLRATETVSNGLALTFTNQMVTYDYNRLNQVLTSAPPSQVFAYDEDGNMTRGLTPDGLQFLASYDAENRLRTITVTNDGTVTARIEYSYPKSKFLGQAKQEQPGVGTNQVHYIRSGCLVIQERDAFGNVTRDFAWGSSQGGGIGGLLNLQQSGQIYSPVYDGKGNVTAVLDASQITAVAYGYDTFGVLLSVAGSLDQPFRFSTKPYDHQTGLSYFGFRFYSAPLARWTVRDPIGEREDSNLYAFVGNNPINAVDPLGLWRWYGCWGGPGWGNCREQPEDTDFPRRGDPGFREPVDQRDSCYYAHDTCLRDCGKDPCPKTRQQCRRGCDAALAGCLARLPWWQWMFDPTLPPETTVFGNPWSPNNNPGEYRP